MGEYATAEDIVGSVIVIALGAIVVAYAVAAWRDWRAYNRG